MMGFMAAPTDVVLVDTAPAETVGSEDTVSAERVAGAFLLVYAGNTLAAYRRDLHQWFAWCAAFDTDPLVATRPLVQAYLAEQRGRGRSAATIARKVSVVGGFYRYAADEGHVARSPVPQDRKRLNLPRVSAESATLGPDVEQARALVAAARGRGARDYAIMLTLLSTGMRVSELTALRIEDMGHHDARRYLTAIRKGGKRQRLVLVPDAAAAVDAMLEHRAATDVGTAVAVPGGRPSSAPLFTDADGAPLTREAVAHIVRWCSRAAGGPVLFSPHALRHTAVTLMIEAGKSLREVQVAAGHVDPSTTQRYSHDQESLSKSPLLVLDGVFTRS